MSQNFKWLAATSNVHELISSMDATAAALRSSHNASLSRDTTSEPSFHPPLTLSERRALLESCEDLLNAAKGPREHLIDFANTHRAEAALQYAIHFRIHTFIPIENGNSITFADLATLANIPVTQCFRVVRLLATYRIFHEPELGLVAHTPESRVLLDEHTGPVIGWLTDESFRSAACLSTSAEKWQHSQKATEAPLNLAFDTELPMFKYLSSEEPWRAQRFRKVMEGTGQSPSVSLDHLVQGFDWGSLPNGALVVDIGGSAGHYCRAIRDVHPHLRFVVQDIKSGLGENLGKPDADTGIRFMEYDFFTPQTIEADVFLLRWICHDYPDEEAGRILRAQIPAMSSRTKLLIMDRVVKPPGEQSNLEQRNARLQDIGMWVLLNAVERDMDGWRSLVSRVDPRFRLMNVNTPPGSSLSVMELQLQDDEK